MDAPNGWLFVPLHSGRGYRGKAGLLACARAAAAERLTKGLPLCQPSHAKVTESAPVMRRSRA